MNFENRGKIIVTKTYFSILGNEKTEKRNYLLITCARGAGAVDGVGATVAHIWNNK